MSNKNTKKRRRVVMTSDIVPAGTRNEVSPERDGDDAASALEISENAPASAETAEARDIDEQPKAVETTAGGVRVIRRGKRGGAKTHSNAEPIAATGSDVAEDRGVEASAIDRGDDGRDTGGDNAESTNADSQNAVNAACENADGGDPDGESAASEGAESENVVGENAVDANANDEDTVPSVQGSLALGLDENDADEATEPAARGDELWTPEETEPAATTVPAADLSRAHLKGLIEALVFVSDQPLSLNEIAKAAGKADRKLVRALADELRQDYARRGIHLDEVAGGLIFRTNPAYGPFIRDAAAKKPVRMTRAQLETLAIIAYRQPLTRPEVDEVRGVDSGPVMKMLLERDLIKILGKKDEPGRPLLYGTTHNFLEFFGLKALKDLPSLREFTELSDDSRRTFDREMADSPDGATETDLATLAAAASAAASATGSAGSVESTAEDEARGTAGEARVEGEAEPVTARVGEGVSVEEPTDESPVEESPTHDETSEWADRPSEPDTTVDALGVASETESAVSTLRTERDGGTSDERAETGDDGDDEDTDGEETDGDGEDTPSDAEDDDGESSAEVAPPPDEEVDQSSDSDQREIEE